MSWPETLALVGGAGKLHSWSKLTIDPSTSTVSEFRVCGGLAPAYQTTAVGGNTMVFQRTPQPAYDQATMPVVSGGPATRSESALSIAPGPLVVGLMLPDPSGPWPTSATAPNLVTVDADGDGKPGITSLMRNDGKFTGSPTSILQTERIEANYMALRLAYQLSLNDGACGDTLEGTAKLLAYDNLVLGCRVKDRGECRSEELQFLQDNKPMFTLGASAVATVSVVPVDASCAQVVQTLDVPGP